MNNGGKILELQCDAESIEPLAAQRTMHPLAKAWDFAAMIVGLGTLIGATIIQAAIGLSFSALVSIDLLILILGFFIPLHSEELAKKAAETQRAFDSKVYGVKFENCFEDQPMICKYAARYIKKNGSCENLKGSTPSLLRVSQQRTPYPNAKDRMLSGPPVSHHATLLLNCRSWHFPLPSCF